tara:strand:- start:655 stop:1635 length:981 start_codon:yes stop_codon:yes gene_type:complete
MITQEKPKSQKISVLIPSYNQEDCIVNVLKSIEDQSLHPMEIVIRDDHSSDNSFEAAREYANNSSMNIRVYRNQFNLGIYENVDRLFNDSVGEVTCMVGADDLFYKDCFLNLEKHIKEINLDGNKTKFLTITNFEIKYSGKGKRTFNNFQHRDSNIFSYILREDLGWRGFGVSSALVKSVGSWKNLLDEHSLLDNSGDQIINIEEFMHAEKIYFCNFLSSIYVAGVGVSNNLDKKAPKNSIKLNKIIRSKYRKNLSKRDLRYLEFRDRAAQFQIDQSMRSFLDSLIFFIINIGNFGKNNNWLIQAKFLLPLSLYKRAKRIFHKFSK